MGVYFPGPTPVSVDIDRVLGELVEGRPLELRRVDLKEEPGRRGPGGVIQPGERQNEKAADYLAGECACMANTPGGGALVLGAADNAALLGTELDAEWLRNRIHELTDRQITPDVRVVLVNGVRLLLITILQTVQPVSYRGRTTWRIDTSCREVDAATVMTTLAMQGGYDPSAELTGFTITDVRPTALQRARELLRSSFQAGTDELAAASDEDLLRRLGVMNSEGWLTFAGMLLFVGRGDPCLDYMRRRHSAGDSLKRIRVPDRALLDEYMEIENSIDGVNETIHLGRGWAIGQVRQLPFTAIREAIVNGLAHRDWGSPDPTVVEHIGDTLVVSSPGGFVGGVDPSNIITHPSATRNRSLTDAFAKLTLAEREGVGVDRMVRDMAQLGRPLPVISEVGGPYVRTVLIGGQIDVEWVSFLGAVEPTSTRDDVNSVLALRQLAERGWVTARMLTSVLQKDDGECETVLARLAECTCDGEPVLRAVAGGDPFVTSSVYVFGRTARARLEERLARWYDMAGRLGLATGWALERGRISSTELADATGVAVNGAVTTLKILVEDGVLKPSRPNARGRGLYYVPATDEAPATGDGEASKTSEGAS